MSLLNLKKSKPLAKPALRSVEAFIDDALLYAQGQQDRRTVSVEPVTHTGCDTQSRVVPLRKPQKSQTMRHATFTLTPDCIEKLAILSEKSETSRSALIRKWIQENYKNL